MQISKAMEAKTLIWIIMDKFVDKMETMTPMTTTSKQIHKEKKKKERMEQANGIRVNLKSSQNANLCLLF